LIELSAPGGPSSVTLIKRKINSNLGLQILWGNLPETTLLSSPKGLLDNLISFANHEPTNFWTARKILEPASKTLKHLLIAFLDHDLESELLEPLHFPRLKVLEVPESNDEAIDGNRCSWLVTPTNATLVLRSFLSPCWFLSVQNVWMNHSVLSSDNQSLSHRCPLLHTLRIDTYDDEDGINTTGSGKVLIKMLRRRREQTKKKKFKVDGVRIKPIKKIIIDFDYFEGTWFIELLREFVGEVVHASDTNFLWFPETIKLQI